MTPFPPDVGTFCTHLHVIAVKGQLVKFYQLQHGVPFGRRRDYYLWCPNDEGLWRRIQGPSKAILAGPARANEPF